jgi:hypothetical protein
MQGVVPSVTSAGSVGFFAQGGTVSSTSPGTTRVTSELATVSGYVDMSVQLLRIPNIDLAVADELFRAYTETLELEVINGSGATNRLKGLLNVSSIGSVSYTGSTGDALLGALEKGISTHVTNLGSLPDGVYFGPAVAAYLAEKFVSTINVTAGLIDFNRLDGDPQRFGNLNGIPMYVTPQMPTTLGASTNESRIIFTTSSRVILEQEDRDVQSMFDVMSGDLAVRILFQRNVRMYVPRPEAVTVISGSGLANLNP